MRGTSALLAVLMGVAAASASAAGLPAEERFRCVEEVVLRHEGVDRDDDLGRRLAFDGDTLLSGFGSFASGEEGALVHVREGGVWRPQAALLSEDPYPARFRGSFPESVALHGDVAVLGRPRSEPAGRNSGVVHVFERVGEDWFETAVLTPPGQVEGDRFGAAVAVEGDRILVGAPHETPYMGDPGLGAAHVFVRTPAGWEHEARLVPSGAVDEHFAGGAVALRGDRLAIATVPSLRGRLRTDPLAHRVTLFERGASGWTEVAELRPPAFEDGERFGAALSLGAGRALVGAPADGSTGGARVFVEGPAGWAQEARLTAPARQASWEDGGAVALAGELAVMSGRGLVHVFRKESAGWEGVTSFDGLASGRETDFGAAVGLVGRHLAVGAPLNPYAENPELRTGVHVFRCRDLLVPLCEPERRAIVEGRRPASETGRGLALDGDLLAVGSPGERSVRLLRDDGSGRWTTEAELTAAGSVAGDAFGRALALLGDVLVVGAPFHPALGPSAGAAWVFERGAAGGWAETAFLLAPDGETLDGFGLAVDLDGERIAIGAHRDGDRGGAAGAVHVFVRSGLGWAHEAKLVADDGDGTEQLGYELALEGDVVIAGAHGEDHDVLGLSIGAAYVYRRVGGAWVQSQKLLAPNAGGGDQFGISVDMDGGRALIGAWRDGVGTGHLFEERGGSWTAVDRLQPSAPDLHQRLGTSVALDGERALLGDPWHAGGGSQAGAALLFVEVDGQWQEQALVSSPDAAPLERFGTTVALSGDRLAAGAPLAGAGVSSVGRAGVFACERNRPPSCSSGEDLAASCDGVALEAQAEDPDGDRLAFAWSSDCPEALFLPGPDVPDPVVVFGSSCGVDCALRLEVVDEGGLRCSDAVRVVVDDETAPTLEPPAPLSLECEGPDGFAAADPRLAAWLASAVASDDCSEAPVGHDAPDRFEVRCPGEPPQSVRFTATDACGNRAEAGSSVAVVDTTAPELAVPEPLTLECDGAGGLPATDPRIRAWLAEAAAADGCSEPVVSHDAPDFFASGCAPGRATEVAFRAVDACGHETVASSRVIVVDRTPPAVVRSEALLGCLWPPNGAWVRFAGGDVVVEARDVCDPAPPSWAFVDCSSDQPEDGLGDGHRAPDCRLEDGGAAFSVRAERAGPLAAGRTHSVRVVAWDACGNVSEPELVGRVRVPHDRRPPGRDCTGPAR